MKILQTGDARARERASAAAAPQAKAAAPPTSGATGKPWTLEPLTNKTGGSAAVTAPLPTGRGAGRPGPPSGPSACWNAAAAASSHEQRMGAGSSQDPEPGPRQEIMIESADYPLQTFFSMVCIFRRSNSGAMKPTIFEQTNQMKSNTLKQIGRASLITFN